jgi:hypothetical protein
MRWCYEGSKKRIRGKWMWANQNSSMKLSLYPKTDSTWLSSNTVRPYSYRKANGTQNQARILKTQWKMTIDASNVTYETSTKKISWTKAIHYLSHILSHTLQTCLRNHHKNTIKTKKTQTFLSHEKSATNYKPRHGIRNNKINERRKIEQKTRERAAQTYDRWGRRNETRVNWRRAMAKPIEQNDCRLPPHEVGSGVSWTGIKTKSLGTQSPAEKIGPWQLGPATKSTTRNEDRALGVLHEICRAIGALARK